MHYTLVSLVSCLVYKVLNTPCLYLQNQLLSSLATLGKYYALTCANYERATL